MSLPHSPYLLQKSKYKPLHWVIASATLHQQTSSDAHFAWSFRTGHWWFFSRLELHEKSLSPIRAVSSNVSRSSTAWLEFTPACKKIYVYVESMSRVLLDMVFSRYLDKTNISSTLNLSALFQSGQNRTLNVLSLKENNITTVVSNDDLIEAVGLKI